ncbi:MAG: epoxyqueuosine reductase QueH [Clostridiales bacterium]|nr:epoxyqueuosine reductase QueH [Clostridiales bacterium]
MNRKNYQREMEQIINQYCRTEKAPSLLLHSCCGPCSSAVMERLTPFFEVTIFYYNPNIYPDEEYHLRAREQEELIRRFPAVNPIHFLEGEYHPEEFYHLVRGYEKEPEGGERCFLCYEQRLRAAATAAKNGDFDFFTTTLSISPLKNADKLNEIGQKVAEEYGQKYLLSDFKKKNGYVRSVELSEKYGMYRQDYCGCVYSLRRDFIGKSSV